MKIIGLRYLIQGVTSIYAFLTTILTYTLDNSLGFKAYVELVYAVYGLILFLALLLLLGLGCFIFKQKELGKEFLMNILYSLGNYLIITVLISLMFT